MYLRFVPGLCPVHLRSYSPGRPVGVRGSFLRAGAKSTGARPFPAGPPLSVEPRGVDLSRYLIDFIEQVSQSCWSSPHSSHHHPMEHEGTRAADRHYSTRRASSFTSDISCHRNEHRWFLVGGQPHWSSVPIIWRRLGHRRAKCWTPRACGARLGLEKPLSRASPKPRRVNWPGRQGPTMPIPARPRAPATASSASGPPALARQRAIDAHWRGPPRSTAGHRRPGALRDAVDNLESPIASDVALRGCSTPNAAGTERYRGCRSPGRSPEDGRAGRA